MKYFVCFMFLILFQMDSLPWISPNTIRLPKGKFPSEINLNWLSPQEVGIEYTFDETLESFHKKLFKKYRPDYSGVVLIDANSGNILTNSFHTKEKQKNFNFETQYISASLFKVITAAAALNEKKLTPSSRINHIGRSHTLRRSQLRPIKKKRRWMRTYTLEDALSKSINAVFGRIGIYHLGFDLLEKYAQRALFNSQISFVQELDQSFVTKPKNSIQIARLASGYGYFAKMSPLHASLIAASILNDGKIPNPNIIRSVIWDGEKYFSHYQDQVEFINSKSANDLKKMLQKTVRSGTARKSFRRFKYKNRQCGMGGKTGYLYGKNPRGYHDWFMGFMCVKNPKYGKPQKLAIAVLTINKDKWKYKSSWLARRTFEEYLRIYSDGT